MAHGSGSGQALNLHPEPSALLTLNRKAESPHATHFVFRNILARHCRLFAAAAVSLRGTGAEQNDRAGAREKTRARTSGFSYRTATKVIQKLGRRQCEGGRGYLESSRVYLVSSLSQPNSPHPTWADEIWL